MNTKKLLVSFVMLVSLLFVVSTVSAAALTNNPVVKIDEVNVNSNPAIATGTTVLVKVEFTAEQKLKLKPLFSMLKKDRHTQEHLSSKFLLTLRMILVHSQTLTLE